MPLEPCAVEKMKGNKCKLRKQDGGVVEVAHAEGLVLFREDVRHIEPRMRPGADAASAGSADAHRGSDAMAPPYSLNQEDKLIALRLAFSQAWARP